MAVSRSPQAGPARRLAFVPLRRSALVFLLILWSLFARPLSAVSVSGVLQHAWAWDGGAVEKDTSPGLQPFGFAGKQSAKLTS